MESKITEVKVGVMFENFKDELTVPSNNTLEDLILKFNDATNHNVDKFKCILKIKSDTIETKITEPYEIE